MFKAALFDLDGVVFNTEPQYTEFWGQQCRLYHPELPGLEQQIKGQTLEQIFDKYFADQQEEQPKISERLNAFEQQMTFEYVAGFTSFVDDLRSHGVKTAVVTSSNQPKMQNVYRSRPEFRQLFDVILTAEDFARSKPDPDCYLRAARYFGLQPSECVVFEDNFNGLKSGRAAQMKVVGLATTNPVASIEPLSDCVVEDYCGLNFEKIAEILSLSR